MRWFETCFGAPPYQAVLDELSVGVDGELLADEGVVDDEQSANVGNLLEGLPVVILYEIIRLLRAREAGEGLALSSKFFAAIAREVNVMLL